MFVWLVGMVLFDVRIGFLVKDKFYMLVVGIIFVEYVVFGGLLYLVVIIFEVIIVF